MEEIETVPTGKKNELIQLESESISVEKLVREFLNFSDEDIPICETCDIEYHFRFDYSGLPKIEITCETCEDHLVWTQNLPERMWQELHLKYFMERYLQGESIRCPFDDCQVSVSEYSDELIEFRCLFCNRRGKKDRSER